MLCAMTKRELKLESPSVEDWYLIIYDILVMESIPFSMWL